jgi:hypothetical protein
LTVLLKISNTAVLVKEDISTTPKFPVLANARTYVAVGFSTGGWYSEQVLHGGESRAAVHPASADVHPSPTASVDQPPSDENQQI